jgi:hypothetical protein
MGRIRRSSGPVTRALTCSFSMQVNEPGRGSANEQAARRPGGCWRRGRTARGQDATGHDTGASAASAARDRRTATGLGAATTGLGAATRLGAGRWLRGRPSGRQWAGGRQPFLGITSIVFCWWGLATPAQVVLAIVFGSIGIRRAKGGATGKNLAVARLICGCVGAAFYVFFGLITLGAGFII